MEGTVREAMREERALVGGDKGGNTLAKVEPVFKWEVLEEIAALAGLPAVTLTAAPCRATGFVVVGLAGLAGLAANFGATFLATAFGINLALDLAADLADVLALEATGFFAAAGMRAFLAGLAIFFVAGLAAGFASFAGLAGVTGTKAFFNGLALAAGFLSLALAALALAEIAGLASGLLALAGALVLFSAAFTCCLPAEITSSCAKLAS